MFSVWDVKANPRSIVTIKLNWTLMYLSLLKNTVPDLFVTPFYQNNSLINFKSALLNSKIVVNAAKSNNPTYNNLLHTNFKTNYKVSLLFNSSILPNNTKAKTLVGFNQDLKLFNSFKSYLRINSSSHSTINTPHFSFKSFYLGYRRGGVSVININKFYNRWKDVYYLIFNLHYYKLEVLTFGTSFFKNELAALNWQVMSKFKFMWRYTKPFLFFKANKITIYGDFVFHRLSLIGLNIAMVIDILYHNKTIYYLHRSHFYTIGLVPINYNINSVNFAIPSSSDNVFSQIFFIRFMTLTQQNTYELKYKQSKKLWLTN